MPQRCYKVWGHFPSEEDGRHRFRVSLVGNMRATGKEPRYRLALRQGGPTKVKAKWTLLYRTIFRSNQGYVFDGLMELYVFVSRHRGEWRWFRICELSDDDGLYTVLAGEG